MESTSPNQETKTEQKEEGTKKNEKIKEDENQQGKNDPQTLSEGERMGLSKQQLRKLEKRLAVKKKKEAKEQEVKTLTSKDS